MAEVHINKLAAASRLIDASIAMLTAEFDDLAICVVASSARNLLAEMKAARGGDHVDDMARWGVFYVARDHLAGTLPAEFYEFPGLIEAIEPIARMIENGEISSVNDLSIKGGQTQCEYWRKANAAFNFLKHADRDPNQLLDLSEVGAIRIVLEACVIYTQLGGTMTDSMVQFRSGMTGLWK
jgi:hypothetical protein